MDAIKKKMQAMKLEKDNAQDKADTCEGQAKEANMRADKVLEEVQDLTKKLSQVENDLTTNKANLEQANKDLEEREKSLTNVRIVFFICLKWIFEYLENFKAKLVLKNYKTCFFTINSKIFWRWFIKNFMNLWILIVFFCISGRVGGRGIKQKSPAD